MSKNELKKPNVLNMDEFDEEFNEFDEQNDLPEISNAETLENEIMSDIETEQVKDNLKDIQEFFDSQAPEPKIYFYLHRKFTIPETNKTDWGAIFKCQDDWLDNIEIHKRYGGGHYSLRFTQRFEDGTQKSFSRNIRLEGRSLDPVIWNEKEERRKMMEQTGGLDANNSNNPLEMYNLLKSQKSESMTELLRMKEVFGGGSSNNNDQMFMLMMKQQADASAQQMQMFMSMLPLLMQKNEKDITPANDPMPYIKMFEKGMQLANGQFDEEPANDKEETFKMIAGIAGAFVKGMKDKKSESVQQISEKEYIKIPINETTKKADEVIRNLEKITETEKEN